MALFVSTISNEIMKLIITILQNYIKVTPGAKDKKVYTQFKKWVSEKFLASEPVVI